ncbi:MAG: 1,2-diacylglycerol 3-glucosyltransferase [Parcubacteria group bacterium Gr01-1014_56]|nr:MAG: 1,2-diacylglycerol 3-glucosyltransferase [Parcubacteria group bacterium Gr01-1014_56]
MPSKQNAAKHDMQKRILIFSLAYYPSHVSGAEVSIKEITDRIPRTDIAFDMITLQFDRQHPLVEMVGNVRVYRVKGGGSYISKVFFPLFAGIGAYRLHRKFHYDAFWVMMTYMLFPLAFAKLLGIRGPYVLTLQDGDTYEKVFERWFIKPVAPILNWGFRNATMIQAISTYLATWPKRRGYKYHVEVIPNGASIQSSQEYPQGDIDALKMKLGRKEGDVYLLSVGRLVHQKAIDDVIRALTHLPAHIHLVVAGEGPDKDALMELAHKEGVAQRVQFVGHVDRTETAKYRKACDIFVLPSRSEGQGISFLSTMAAKIPVVATQEGGIADFLFDAKRNPDKPTTGWAVDKNNPKQIAAAVKEIIADHERTKVVTETAYTMVIKDYNWDIIAKDMQQKVFSRLF